MKKIVMYVLITASIVGGLLPLHDATAAIVEPGFEVTIVADGFSLPTALAFAPDGRIFVAEKGGSVRVVENGVVLALPLITLSDINTFGDRGLIGMAIDPNFTANGYLYLSYTYENSPGANFGGPKTGRIVRVTVVGNSASESSKVVLVGTVSGSAASPSCEDFPAGTDCIPSDSPSHTVGGLKFGLDGKLYATLGDGADFSTVDPRALRAQNVDSLAGKVLRVNPDGTAPTDNPFYNGDPNANRSKVFALGVRNMFRINFHPTTGMLFGGDVGWNNWEEINRITPGANYGWPCREGNGATTYGCTPSSTTTLPVYTYGHDSAGAGSITMGAFPANGAYPAAYDNTLFIGDYAQNWMKLIELDAAGNMIAVKNFIPDTVWPVDIATGPDGNVYYIDIALASVHRITHTTGNRRPVPVVSANPTSGLAPLSVAFSSAGSNDPDGNPLTYSWNFGDGSTSNAANPTHIYNTNGSYNATLTLTDSLGSSAAKFIAVSAGNQAPTASIDSPASGSLYTPGQLINLTGSGTDPEEGVLPASAFHWDVLLHHNTHVHFVQQIDDVKNPSIVPDDHSDPDVYMEVVLTVTDSAGLTSTRSINLYLNNGAGSGNLIGNPSMETQDPATPQPLGWFPGWYGVMNPTFTYPVAGFEGARAAKVEVTGYAEGSAKWYFSPISVTPGQVYAFSNQYTATVPTVQYAQFGFANGTHQYVPFANLAPATTPTPVAYTIAIPAGVETLTIFHELAGNGELTTDDFSLTLTNPGDTTGPSANITAPTTGATVSGSVTVLADATDNVAVTGVVLLIDDAQVGVEDTEGPFGFIWNSASVSDGAHTVKVRARDAAGNTTTSAAVNVTVQNGSGATNLIPNPSLETAAGEADPANWLRGGWGTNDRVFTYPTPGVDGADAAKVEITSYTNGDSKWYFQDVAVTPGTAYALSSKYKSTIPTELLVRYTLGGGATQYSFVQSVPASAIWATLTNTVTPPANTASMTVFHVLAGAGSLEIDDFSLSAPGGAQDTTAPTVSLSSPTNGSTVSGNVTAQIDATDNVTLSHVFFAVDGVNVGFTYTTTPAPYSIVWDSSTVANGTHTATAVAYDVAGNHATSTAASITVNNGGAVQNLIQNPSLETAGANGDPDKWLRGGWGTNTRVFTYPTVGIDGADAARVEITSYTDGDAKWHFQDVPVTPGTTYTFSHKYKSTVPTEILARYTMTGGAVQYQFLGTLPAAAAWATTSYSITPPANTASLTIFHLLHSMGTLETDDFDLHGPGTPAEPENLIANGNFETVDGTEPLGWDANSWGNHTAVFNYPIVGFDGNKGARLEITSYPGNGTGDSKWKFDKLPVTQGTEYTYSDHYRSSTISDIIGQYTLTDGSFHYFGLAKEIQPNAAWQTIERTFIPPANATHVTFFHLISAVGFLEMDDADMHVSGSGTPSETEPPVVEFTNPLNGQTVSGTVPVTASSTDNVAVTYIFYAVDGIPVTGQITESPYLFNWNTTTVADGPHTLKATTHDPSGNNSTHTITITVDNTTPAPANLIQNPSLETAGLGGNPDHWSKGGWGTNNRVFTYPTTGADGADAAKVEITSYTDGDAKWFFENVPATPGNVYTFEHQYRANVATNLTIRYLLADGTTLYLGLGNPATTGATWATDSKTFTIPANVVSMTIMHILASVGSLEVDDYSLIAGNANQFATGLVSLSFDDGWLTHYTEALPKLDAANIDGTFYIVSKETAEAAPVELIANPTLETVGTNGDPAQWLRGGWGSNTAVFTYPAPGDGDETGAKIEITSYTDGDAKWFFEDVPVLANQAYAIAHRYRSTVPTEVYLRYRLTSGSFRYIFSGALPETSGTWQNFTGTVTPPADAVSLTVFHVLTTVGELTTDNHSVKRVQVYVTPAQMLALQASGHEIGAHTRTHPDLTTLTPAEQQDQIAGSQGELLAMGATSVATLAYPLGAYNDSIKATTVAAGYNGARSVDRGYNSTISDKYALRIQQINRTTTIADVQGWIQQASQDKTWLILMFHQIDADPAHELGATPASLQEIINAVVAADVNVVTVAQGIAQMNP